MIGNEDEKALVHSFNENFIFGLRLDNLGIGPNAKVDMSSGLRSGIITLTDIITSDGSDNGIEMPKLFGKVESVSIAKRSEPRSQVFSGNLAIDFTNPLLQGTFNTFIAENTHVVKRSNIYRDFLTMNPNHHFVYFSPNRDHCSRFDGIAKETSQNGRYTVFSPKLNDKAETLLLSKIIPHFLNYLRQNGKNVVFIIEDIEVLYMELYGLFKNNPTDLLYSFIREIQTLCYNTTNGSISTICFRGATSNVDIQFQRLLDNLSTELTLLSTAVIDSADKATKKGVKTAVAGFNFKLMRTKAFSPLQAYLSHGLYNLLLHVS